MKLESYQSTEGIVSIYYDEDAQSPREWDNMWMLVSNKRDIHLDETGLGLDFIVEKHKTLSRDYLIVPVYMYDHSIVRLSVKSFLGRAPHAEWDSGVGFFAVVSKARLREEYGCKRITKSILERAMKCLEGEANCLADYYNGEVYGFTVKDENGDEIDSCWGYYGTDGIEAIKAEYPELTEVAIAV